MSNFKEANERVTYSWKMLQQQWATTTQQWNDTTTKRFEKDFLQEFEPAVREIVGQLDHLERLLAQARREIK